jgi:drug/metabolite transporter (DMT)-like permease
MGFLLSQNTFQQGRLVSPAVAVITSADPVVGVLVGVSWLGERIDTSPAHLAGAAIGAAVVVAGIALISARGSYLLHRLDESDQVPAAQRIRMAPS